MKIIRKEQPFEKGMEGSFEAIAVAPKSNQFALSHPNDDSILSKPSNVSFKALRQIARYDSITRICINVIKKSVSQCKWEVKAKKDVEVTPEIQAQIDFVTNLFTTQNNNNENMRLLLDRVLEDLLVLDAGVIEKIYEPSGELVGLNSVDGATIRPIYNSYGELGDPAYAQYIREKRVADFEKNELIYIMQNPQNDIDHFGYGLSPIESILVTVQASLQADLYNARVFSEDNVPPGLLDLGDINHEEAMRFKQLWDATVLDNTHKMKMVYGPGDKKTYTPFTTNNKDMQYVEYIDWLSKVKLAAYGLSGIDANLMQDVNRATAEVQESISTSRGVNSTKRLLEEILNREIIVELEYNDIEFKFEVAISLQQKQEEADIKKTEAETDKLYIEAGVLTPDEVREREGLAPLGVVNSSSDEFKTQKKYYPPIN